MLKALFIYAIICWLIVGYWFRNFQWWTVYHVASLAGAPITLPVAIVWVFWDRAKSRRRRARC